MKIKGYDIDNLMTIKDTTPGAAAIWIMLIMLLGVFIIYQLTLMYWSVKKVEKLKYYERVLKKGPEAVTADHSRQLADKPEYSYKTDGQRSKTRIRRDDSKDEDEEALEILRNLQR